LEMERAATILNLLNGSMSFLCNATLISFFLIIIYHFSFIFYFLDEVV
jgi:hypothetical protein